MRELGASRGPRPQMGVRLPWPSIPLSVCADQPVSVRQAVLGSETAGMPPHEAPNQLWILLCKKAGIEPEERGALDRLHEEQPAIGRGTYQRIKEGMTGLRVSTVERLSAAFGLSSREIIEAVTGIPHSDEQDEPSVAQAVSHRRQIVAPRKIVWEDLVREVLDGLFEMEIVGDALAPGYLPGQSGIWEPGDKAKPGQPVLIKLPGDRFELRLMETRGATWAGVSQRPGHGELQPERDGAQIVARLRYVDLG